MAERWNINETQRALFLYFQMPFGRLHKHAPEIIDLAQTLGRTPSSIAMKLANFASLDPKITGSGRKGLQGASLLDRQIFRRFYGDWDGLVAAVADDDRPTLSDPEAPTASGVQDRNLSFRGFEGRSEVEVVRIERRGQLFFRRAVLANYDERCCITGIADRRLLNASHIKPWQIDVQNRHNPRNGLALSATFDRAFDRGLITIQPDLTVKVSYEILNSTSLETANYFCRYHGQKISVPQRFLPDYALLIWHNENLFLEGPAFPASN